MTVGILSLGVTARMVRRFGAMRVLVGGMVTAILGLALLTTTGAHTSFFPTIFFAYFAIGLGIGNAFMPLLTIAMADVPAADAGLGSGITNVSQQVAGALGLAVLGTIATNHSKALEAQGHTLASSLISGYHLAFAIGAVEHRDRHPDGARRAAHAEPRRGRWGRRPMKSRSSTYPRSRRSSDRPHKAEIGKFSASPYSPLT